MPSPTRYWVAAACWLGAIFRYRSLFANHFHADEALFAGWARQIAVWRDPWLLNQAVDKPPLLFYLQAGFYPLFGPVEWAARLPNFIVSLLLVPLLGLLAWRLYGDGLTAVVVAMLLALSPMAIQFSATAFTDPLLSFWLVASLVAVAKPPLGTPGRSWPVMAGASFALAAATKYQAWLYLPLLIALAQLGGWGRREWLRGILSAAGVGVVLAVWLMARADSGSLLAIQLANAGGLRPSWSWELWPRLAAWVQLWRVSLGWPVFILTGLAVAGFWASHQHEKGRRLLNPVDGLMALFIVAYHLFHWLFAVPVWDRYLLPILPLILLLLARVVTLGFRRFLNRQSVSATSRFGTVVLTGVLGGLLLVPASAARLSRMPMGGQPAADQGAWQVAEQLRDAPYGTVLYDHWYSWQWGYHLFDSGVYVSWFPYPDALREDLEVFGGDGSSRYLVLPDSPVADPVRRVVAEAGFDLVAQFSATSGSAHTMTLYRLEKATP